MAKKGDLARESVKDTIVEAFKTSNNFITIQDKKIYVQAKDGSNGETIQFAISLTMPKTPIGAPAGTQDGLDFSESPTNTSVSTPTPTELSPEDRAKVDELKKLLGIID